MKRFLALILCCLLFITAVYPAASAASPYSLREEFDDGSYITVTYSRPSSGADSEGGSWEDLDASESEESGLNKIIRWIRDFFKMLFAKKSTVEKTKYCNYFDSKGKLLWSVSLKGTFTYNHRNAVCVSSEITYEITDSDWKIISCKSSEENNTAKGSFAIRQYKLGVPLKLIEKELTLTCDKQGNVK